MENFKSLLREQLEELTEGRYEVVFRKVTKNNDLELTAVSLCDNETNIVPSIYIDEMYESYQAGTDIEKIARQIVEIHERNKKQKTDMSWVLDWERVKPNVIFDLIGRENNEKLLPEIPYISYLDMAIAFRIMINDENVEMASIRIRRDMMIVWGVTVAELMEVAKENTQKKLSLEVTPIHEIINDAIGQVLEPIPMFVVSNNKRLNGAGAFLYDGVLKEFGKKLGSNFYILPSSTHETIFVIDNDMIPDLKEIKEMVALINSTELRKEDVLTNSVYYYDLEEEEVLKM